MTVSSPLLGLLRRAITADCLGGVFSSASVDSLDQILDELDRADFQPFPVKGEKTADSRIRAVVDAGYVEADLLTTWEEFLKHRGVLANDIAAISVSPLVALVSEPTLLSSAREYLDAYEHLLAIVRTGMRYFRRGLRRASGRSARRFSRWMSSSCKREPA